MKLPNMKSYLCTALLLVFAIQIALTQSKSEQLDALMESYTDNYKFNGSVLIAYQGELLLQKGYGLANVEWNMPNSPTTKHRLGSITKQFTGMIILQLAQEGKLDLQSVVTTYLPDYPKKSGDIVTIHHLLSHTSGIPNYTAFPGFFRNVSIKPYETLDFVGEFADKELEFEPGAQFAYSNSGYFLLGVIAETITGKTYETLLQERIFTPLGMNDSGYDHHKSILKERATGYERRGTKMLNARYLDMSIPYAAGAIYSTVEDLYKWDQALYTNQLLDAKHMELFFKPAISSGRNAYAYGWAIKDEMVGNTQETVRAIAHDGGINGFNTYITRCPDDKEVIILLNNTSSAQLNKMVKAIRGIVRGKSIDAPKNSLTFSMLNEIEENGIEAGLMHFDKYKDSDEYEIDENEMNDTGYSFMRDGSYDIAAKILKLNVEAFPNSFNVYDSYAEALMNLGQNDEAIANYIKSVELNPSNDNGFDMLERLGYDTTKLVDKVSIPDAVLAKYVGEYELMPELIISITKEGSQLKAKATGQGQLDIFPRSETEFYIKGMPIKILFNVNQKGETESLTLFQGGREMLGKKR